MAGLSVSIAERALKEVASIARWWQKNRLSAPRLLQQELDAALQTLAGYPERGRRFPVRRYPAARSYVLQRSGYVVLYTIVAETLLVIRVRHGKRRPLKRR